MIRGLRHGAAARRSIQCHVIYVPCRHQRFQSQKPLLDSYLPSNYFNEQIAQDVFSGHEVAHLSQAGRPAEASHLKEIGVHGRTTISLILGFPPFEEAPDVLKSCYVDGILKKPRQFIEYALLARHTTAEKSKNSNDIIKFHHRLILKAPGLPEVQVLGKGASTTEAENTAYYYLISKLYNKGLLHKVYSDLKNGIGVGKISNIFKIDRFSIMGRLIDIKYDILQGINLTALTDPAHPDQKFRENETSAAQVPTDNSKYFHPHANGSQNSAFNEAHNNCARLGLVPTVRVTSKIQNNLDLNELTLHVELPQHKIFVSVKAIAAKSRLQEQVAFTTFNRKMKECGLLKTSETTQARVSPKSLNLLNAEGFVRFSRDTADISFSGTRCFKYFLDEIKLNGVVVGIGCSVSKKSALEAAWLMAAVHVANSAPDLLEKYFDSLELTPRTDDTQPATQASHIQELLSDPTIMRSINIDLPPKNLLLVENALTGVDKAQRANRHAELRPDYEPLHRRGRKTIEPLSSLETSQRSEQLVHTYRQYKSRDDLQGVHRTRSRLPASRFSRQIFDLLSENVYSIIVGATGSGKTTQVPQIILDHFMKLGKGAECNIFCTQPRVIGAISVAKRVAEERGQEIGDQVGYLVRLEKKFPMLGGSITYCTTGIILRTLQTSPDYVFDNISHIIIDEVHARDTIIDFTLAVLKTAVLERLKSGKKVPRIIIMSATVKSDLFASYFQINDAELGLIKCPTLEVPGRAFSVRETYLDDILKTLSDARGETAMLGVYQEETTRKYLVAEAMLSNIRLPACFWNTKDLTRTENHMDEVKRDSEQVPLALVTATITHLATTTKDGAILVFLTGIEKLMQVQAMLQGHTDFQDQRKYRFFLLHSALTEDQKDVFKSVPKGCRKIILSTNVAETSVTIPDVKYVVDSGKYRELVFDQHTHVSSLPSTWISQSSSKQRAGRAGRVQEGHYYALFTKRRRDMLDHAESPELLRVDLQSTCLSIKGHGGASSIRHFLSQAIERPSAEKVDAAIANLTALEALTADEETTPLGRLLVSLPMHPSLGKMVILGIIYKCLDPMLILAASFNEHQPLFKTPIGPLKMDASASRMEFAASSRSDHVGVINAFSQLRRVLISEGETAMEDFASRSLLSSVSFFSTAATARHVESLLETTGLTPPNEFKTGLQYGAPSLNQNSSKEALVRAVIAGCMSIGVRQSPNLYSTPSLEKVVVHRNSVNVTVSNPKTERILWPARQRLLAYSSVILSGGDGTSAFMRETTDTSPLTAVLFGKVLSGPEMAPGDDIDVLKVDGWIDVEVPRAASGRVLALHRAMRDMEREAFTMLDEGRFRGANTAKRDSLVEDVVNLLEQDAEDVEMIALESELAIRAAIRKVERRHAEEGGITKEENEVGRERARVMEEEGDEVMAQVVREWRRSSEAV